MSMSEFGASWARSPTLHFLLMGLFFWGLVRVANLSASPMDQQREILRIPRSRVLAEQADWESILQRRLVGEEIEKVRQSVIDQEILFRHALDLGLDQGAAVERRLNLIADFVGEMPHEAPSSSGGADSARNLGLVEQDLVVRRILIDAVSRLIKGAVKAQDFEDAYLADYLRAHPEEFQIPSRFSFSHVALNKSIPRQDIEAAARALKDRLNQSGVPPEAEHGLGEISSMPLEARYEGLSKSDLRRTFGRGFAERVAFLPSGSWQGPVESRYGLHLVYVTEASVAGTPTLDECREKVRSRVADLLADQWLTLRVEQLRASFEVEILEEQDT